jgi:hypothetical protein
MTQQVVLLIPAKVAEFRRRALYEQWQRLFDPPRLSQNGAAMTDPDWKAELRRELDTAGEEQVRAELRGLSTGAEDRRLFIVGWLQEKEKARKAREAWFYWGSLVLAGLAFLVTVAGIIATMFAH